MPDSSGHNSLGILPLFPLPNVVLLPRGVLPLHIFEPRYKALVADAISADGRIAMALLKPGWEKSYYSRPEIEQVVCVGRIVSHEQLPDGKYNLLLQGSQRAQIVEEVGEEAYRTARLETLPELNVLEIDLDGRRRKLAALFDEGAAASLPAAQYFRNLLRSTASTSDIADLVAFNVLDDESGAAMKQQLLASPDPRWRIDQVLQIVSQVRLPPRALRGLPDEPSLN